MKRIIIFAFLFCIKSAFAQDMIYLTDGTKIPGKIVEIDANKVKFKNLANPNSQPFVRNLNYVRVAFNAVGNYIVFDPANPLKDADKKEFILNSIYQRPFDILVDNKGTVIPVSIIEDNDNEVAAVYKGKELHYKKADFLLVIRKNGSHEFYSSVDKAIPFLGPGKQVIRDILSQPMGKDEASVTAAKIQIAKKDDGEFIAPDLALFGTKSLQKTEEFTNYLQAISSVSTDRAAAVKSIDQACGLFLNEQARVEVSSTAANAIPKKYFIRDYLTRLMIKSGQYDKVNIEYADINYASKFRKGPDGNYYGTVTFVQKFQGFVDGNLVYGDQTTRNLTIVIKHYEKAINGQIVAGWDVFLDDMGITETKKL